ncbi:MAG TPA: YlxR family protein [Nocardioidaceae bacterium]|nr:YlxR family protein [Nocardioidaceae bacterium]
MFSAQQGPVRTCVGCRERAPKKELLRVVAGDGTLVPDPAGRAPGRGAHVHPTPECLALALRRRAFVRALRARDGLAPEALTTYVQQLDQ